MQQGKGFERDEPFFFPVNRGALHFRFPEINYSGRIGLLLVSKNKL
jgi:hypothetical protein